MNGFNGAGSTAGELTPAVVGCVDEEVELEVADCVDEEGETEGADCVFGEAEPELTGFADEGGIVTAIRSP